MSEEQFLNIGYAYINHNKNQSTIVGQRRFKSAFGVTSKICFLIWNMVKENVPSGGQPKHLLWCLNFLKQYNEEHTRRSVFSADEKTIRKWTWIFIDLLSELNVIKWDRRFENRSPEQTCFCSLDGVDFKILEPVPFSTKWYSHKFKGPGIRYEVALCINSGNIVWYNGGYPCGEWPDLKIAREAYIFSVDNGELTLADRGYNDKRFFIVPNFQNSSFHKRIMSRHESVNKRIRQFKILKNTFRNQIIKHTTVFRAVINITQIVLENGEPLFSISN